MYLSFFLLHTWGGERTRLTWWVRRAYIQSMQPYPPSDWSKPPTAQRAKQRKVNISPAAAAALDKLKQSLEEWPAWLESTTTSVMIEYLCWLFDNSERRYRGFHPETRRGRPAGPNQSDNFRPANVRKAAGLSKADAALGPELPGG